MKFYKRLPLFLKEPMSSRFAVEADGTIVTNTDKAIQTPRGTTLQRPTNPVLGEIRFNSDLGPDGDLEAYIDYRWQRIKTNRQQVITKQEFDNGDYADTRFGPLAYDIDINFPENMFVYVENVPQIAGLNYTLEYSSPISPITTSTVIVQTGYSGDTVLYVTSVADFNPNDPITGPNINGSVIVDTSATDLTVTITPGLVGTINPGDVVTTTLASGTYVTFSIDSLPVPHKPVITLLGFDGYGPPFEY